MLGQTCAIAAGGSRRRNTSVAVEAGTADPRVPASARVKTQRTPFAERRETRSKDWSPAFHWPPGCANGRRITPSGIGRDTDEIRVIVKQDHPRSSMTSMGGIRPTADCPAWTSYARGDGGQRNACKRATGYGTSACLRHRAASRKILKGERGRSAGPGTRKAGGPGPGWPPAFPSYPPRHRR